VVGLEDLQYVRLRVNSGEEGAVQPTSPLRDPFFGGIRHVGLAGSSRNVLEDPILRYVSTNSVARLTAYLAGFCDQFPALVASQLARRRVGSTHQDPVLGQIEIGRKDVLRLLRRQASQYEIRTASCPSICSPLK
jgi:hypothetical protein